LLLLAGLLVVSVHPSRAAIHWSSTDPVFTFKRNGSSLVWTLDVQVMVQLERLPLSSAAVLELYVPSNVSVVVVNPPNPAFPVVVKVRPTWAAVSRDLYSVKFVLYVPTTKTKTAFPVALLITDPQRASVRFVEGVAGKPLTVMQSVGR